MLVNVSEIAQDQVLKADICIVGGGAAGIALANELRNSGKQVILLESGGFNFHGKTNKLNKGLATGTVFKKGERFLNSARQRFFGGTTNHWTGVCSPLDDFDLSKRDWVEASGWPLSLNELKPYYKRAAKYIGINDFFSGDYKKLMPKGREFLAASDKCHTKYYYFSPKLRMGPNHKDILTKAANIRLILMANGYLLKPNSNRSKIESLQVKTLAGKSFSVAAKQYVLAAGAVENTRLLLFSEQENKLGFDPEGPLGRYYMDHPHVYNAGTIVSLADGQIMDRYNRLVHKPWGHEVLATLGLNSKTKQDNRLQNVLFRLESKKPKGFSKRFLHTTKYLATGRKTAASHFYSLVARAEQAPNRSSRIKLLPEKDSLGMNRVHLDWLLQDRDSLSISKTMQILGLELGRLSQGRIKLHINEEKLWTRTTIPGPHSMGSTRMATDKKQGVVDKNCRVHQLLNLYVTSGSVFPTGGAANPTFTILALAIRLADRLKKI